MGEQEQKECQETFEKFHKDRRLLVPIEHPDCYTRKLWRHAWQARGEYEAARRTDVEIRTDRVCIGGKWYFAPDAVHPDKAEMVERESLARQVSIDACMAAPFAKHLSAHDIEYVARCAINDYRVRLAALPPQRDKSTLANAQLPVEQSLLEALSARRKELHPELTNDMAWAWECAVEVVKAHSEAIALKRESGDEGSIERILKGRTADEQKCFTVNWLRGTIVIPDEVKLRIWLIENGKRGLLPDMSSKTACPTPTPPLPDAVQPDKAVVVERCIEAFMKELHNRRAIDHIEPDPNCEACFRLAVKAALGALPPRRDDSGLVDELVGALTQADEVMRNYTTSSNDEDEWNNDDVIECRELLRAVLAKAAQAKAGAA